MELLNTTFTVLGTNKDKTINIKFVLSSIPTENWTNIFNKKSSKIKSLKNTTSIIFTDTMQNIKNLNVNNIQNLIQKVDQEIFSDTQKSAIILSYLHKGLVCVHDNLNYSGQNSQYQQYLIKISNNQTI